ncbi:class I SAM-dependent methyltransferase [Nocardia huaxiensis]|uniref:Class I SAM-dependent methyltransferase n=1 Tax=Nocardia huaxiensis TaxID=2755382 RepID=A0A7D6VBN1_9NOCA|nr:class I SAM-dependent methyltransferase [Nocardia huaxiensis]QLY28395.1 class I SAM-dependent methyltransferase [Nocardia huaxiensis]UFS98151.1 class I SAM-dependent methyltransferase [Nocardia huaxiensis]
MTSTVESAPVDPDKLMSFVLTAVGEVGAALNAALVVLGDKLGLYRTLAGLGPMTAVELAEATGTDAHYVREWLNAQAAGQYLTYQPGPGTYTLPPERAVALTDPSSPAFLPGLFQLAVGTIVDWPRVLEAARDGSGIGWHEHGPDVHSGCERFFRPAYRAHLVNDWLPALDGVVDTLRRGARVADIGCGHGASTILMAQAFPHSRFQGSDAHPESVRTASRRAADAGVASQARFEVAAAHEFSGDGYDLVTTFDALHDMGDPVGAARRVRQALAPEGTWMIVEPAAGDRVEDNLHPIGRAFYGFSTLLCTPSSLSQPVGAALGTQAGPARLRDVVTAAGFGHCRIAAATPFHMVLEVRR